MTIPKGQLLIIGGAEDKVGEAPNMIDQIKEFKRYEILNELVPNSTNKKIELVTTGSEVQHKVKKTYRKVFDELGYHNVGFMPINSQEEADNQDYLLRAKEAGVVFFTGGDQLRLATILGNTPFMDIIKLRYIEDETFILAGTSAGAMAMSSVMIVGGEVTEALIYRNSYTSTGLGFLPLCIIDTHFIRRGRFGRLAHAIIINQQLLGIGLGEDTALIIKNGSDAECRGSGMVVIIDGSEIGHSNINSVQEGEPVYVENLKVDLLVKGCKFSFIERKLTYGNAAYAGNIK